MADEAAEAAGGAAAAPRQCRSLGQEHSSVAVAHGHVR